MVYEDPLQFSWEQLFVTRFSLSSVVLRQLSLAGIRPLLYSPTSVKHVPLSDRREKVSFLDSAVTCSRVSVLKSRCWSLSVLRSRQSHGRQWWSLCRPG